MDKKDGIDELRDVVCKQEGILIIGAGVSAALVEEEDSEAVTWAGLMKTGVGRLPPFVEDWDKERLGEQICSCDEDSFFAAVNEIVDRLKKYDLLDEWLRDSLGRLRVHNPEVGEALQHLGLPMVTTNYDDLLEQVTTYGRISWRHHIATSEFLQGKEWNRILHLHGVWEDPSSIVLDRRSYEKHVENEQLQEILSPLFYKRWIFVGFGAGLDDHHFRHLFRRSNHLFKKDQPPFVLVSKEAGTKFFGKDIRPGIDIIPIVYGGHGDLWKFLHGLRTTRGAELEAPPDPLTWPKFHRMFKADLSEACRLCVMSRTGIGWRKSYGQFFLDKPVRALFLDPSGNTFDWDTRYQYVPTQGVGRSQPAANVTVKQRAAAARETIDDISKRAGEVKLVDVPLPSVMWILQLKNQRVLYLEIPKYRATYRGNRYLRVSSQDEPECAEMFKCLFDEWFSKAKPA